MNRIQLLLIYIGLLIGTLESSFLHFNMYGAIFATLSIPVVFLFAYETWKKNKK